MLEQAEVLTQWYTDTDGLRAPLIIDQHAVHSMVEITFNLPELGAEHPEPNNFVVRITAETVIMDAIAADANYTIMEGTRQPV
jgi:hypothetical protein